MSFIHYLMLNKLKKIKRTINYVNSIAKVQLVYNNLVILKYIDKNQNCSKIQNYNESNKITYTLKVYEGF